MKPSKQNGVSLIEACAVLAIVSIVAASAIPSLQEMRQAHLIRAVASEIAADLQFMRSESVSRNQTLRISFSNVASGQSCYVIHTGPASACTCEAAGPARCVGEAQEVKTAHQPSDLRTSVHANVGSMVYAPQHGTTTPGGSIFITGADGRGVKHVVSLMGRFQTCSPNGTLTGYPRCRS